MKLTKKMLQQIIKEEIEKFVGTKTEETVKEEVEELEEQEKINKE